MNLEKERKVFESSEFVKTIIHKFEWSDDFNNYQIKDCVINGNVFDHIEAENDRPILNGAWFGWQAAKAQSVPEGFVLVKKVHPDAIVHNQGLSLFKECQVIYGWNGKSKDFKNALNRGFYHGVKLGAKAVLGSEIETQE